MVVGAGLVAGGGTAVGVAGTGVLVLGAPPPTTGK